jgi:hypothetical protein
MGLGDIVQAVVMVSMYSIRMLFIKRKSLLLMDLGIGFAGGCSMGTLWRSGIKDACGFHDGRNCNFGCGRAALGGGGYDRERTRNDERGTMNASKGKAWQARSIFPVWTGRYLF